MSRPWQGIVGKGFNAGDFQAYVDTLDFTWTPDFIVLHNTMIPRFAPWVDADGNNQPGWHDVSGERRMKGLESYYRDDQKWSGGPHLFIADDLIWVFTPLTTHGIHSPSWTEQSWGVETVGDYDKEELPQEIFDNIIAALATLSAAIGVSADTLRFHKEDPATTHRMCPGHNIVKVDIVKALAAALQ